MGLDSVEFVMAVEEAFQIAIPDSEAERMATPRHLVDYVMTRLGETDQRVCLEQRAFYRLRRAAMRVFGVTRSAVQVGTRWEHLLPPKQRRHNWTLLQHAAGITPWPSLTLWGNYRAALATVGGTARYLSSYAPAALKGDGGWSRMQVEDAIRRLMAEHLAIREFDWDDHFGKDLGVD
jgi:acyl carrier protein